MKRPHFALPEIYDDSLSYYEVLKKLIKSMHVIDDNLNKIPEQIANEAKAREQADGTLQTNIDNEKSAREQADAVFDGKISELKGDLSAEQTAREQADTSLQQEISAKLPKSPVDWEPWTADEQAVARERIGITSTLMSFNDQKIPYGAEGLGRIIAGYYKMASYTKPILVAASIALYGNTALVFGVYRPNANMRMLCLEGNYIKCLFKNANEEWSFDHFILD